MIYPNRLNLNKVEFWLNFKSKLLELLHILSSIPNIPSVRSSIESIQMFISSVILLFDMNLFFNDCSFEALEKELHLTLELLIHFFTDFGAVVGACSQIFGDLECDFWVDLLLQFIQLGFVINLFLSEEFEFKVPERGPAKFISFLGLLSLLPYSVWIVDELNSSHHGAVVGPRPNLLNPGETTPWSLLLISRS